MGGWHSWCCANHSRDASSVLTPTLQIQHSELGTPELPAQHWDQGCATNTLGSFPGAASAASTSQFHPSLDLPVQTKPQTSSQAPNVPLGRARHLHLTTEEGTLSLQPERLGNIRRKEWVGELKGPVGGCGKSVTLI